MSEEKFLTALVTAEQRGAYTVRLDGRELPAVRTGRMAGEASSRLDLPIVGDDVQVALCEDGAKAVIHGVLPRRSLLLRIGLGRDGDAQPLAANIDKVFIVMGLDGNYNVARLERVLVAAWDSGALPVVALTKKDLCPEAELADRLAARLSASALEALEGGASMRSLSAVSASAEREFSSFYLSYSAYNSLVRLRELASPGGFSCLYDYAAYRYLAAFFPGAAYPKARRELAAARPALDEALLRADAGDMEGALSGAAARAAELKGAAALAASASAFNRRAQFLLWGVLFRPAELAVSARGGRAAFRPALTFFEVLRR